MRHSPAFLMTDPAEVKRLVAENPWATFVSPTADGLVASHYPVLLDPTAADDELVIVSHFGRPDERAHELCDHEVLVVIQGPHDYVSSSWYASGDIIPTWNHVTAHLYGVPEVLSDEENYRMLEHLTAHFEGAFPGGHRLAEDEDGSRRRATGTVGLRMRVTRFDARAKLSQNKAPEVQARVQSEIASRNPRLGEEMRRVQADDGESPQPAPQTIVSE